MDETAKESDLIVKRQWPEIAAEQSKAKRLPVDRASLDDLEFIGHGLSRPECAVAHASGMVFAPDWTANGGISVIFLDGAVKRHLTKNWLDVARSLSLDVLLRPNGICLLEGGSFLLAHLGTERGGIFELLPDGSVKPFLVEIDGEPLPPSNFVMDDGRGRVWVTVSTHQVPRAAAYRSDVADGFIALVDETGSRIVADGLGYTNECTPHPDGSGSCQRDLCASPDELRYRRKRPCQPANGRRIRTGHISRWIGL